MTTLSFRPFLPADAPVLADLMVSSVAELAADDYDEAQMAAWVSITDDVEAFGKHLAGMLTILAIKDDEIAGFVSLKGEDHLDMLYVSADHAGQGVGKALCDVIAMLAGKRGAKTLTVDASDNASDFFVKQGFDPQRRNSVIVGDEWLANTTMHKTLAREPATGNA